MKNKKIILINKLIYLLIYNMSKFKNFSWVNIYHAKKLAGIMGWEFLDEEFKGIKHKHNWKCENGHLFQMRYANIYFNGNFCKTCRNNMLPEDLDYNNSNNMYQQTKRKIQAGMKKK
jgi:hypothetical protein